MSENRDYIIKKMFDNSDIVYSVPSYQRAYSWEVDSDKKQVKQFYQDLLEQITFITCDDEGGIKRKPYFLGHFIFERDDRNPDKYYIIDGQQRLTTLILFVRVLIDELQRRLDSGEDVRDLKGEPIRLNRIIEMYLEKDGHQKFETVSYDNVDFSQLVLRHANVTGKTASIRRVKNAIQFFERQFKGLKTNDLIKMKDVLDNTIVTSFIVDDKVQATQIFSFQNDRGKDLTSLEIIKAFFMYKIYSSASSAYKAENSIRQIEDVFSEIYRYVEEIKGYDEDSILNFHCTAFIGLNESSIDRIKKWVSTLNVDAISNEITDFCVSLKESFIAMKYLEEKASINSSIADCFLLRDHSCIPLFLKVYRLDGSDSVETVAEIVEKILFKLIFKNADYRTDNLPRIAFEYKNSQGLFDRENLIEKLNLIQQNGFQGWWAFTDNCRSFFEDVGWHYIPEIKYVLWKYENNCREIRKLHLISPVEYKNSYAEKNRQNTLDHITPQNPNFTEYSEEFKEKYLNCIGNLALISWGSNSQKSNNNPIDEISKYDNSEFVSNNEIRDVLAREKRWGAKEIEDRKIRIISFVIEKWHLLQ